MTDARHLPSLGPRGEGWVALQVVGLGVAGLAGLLGPMWDGLPRAMSSIAGFAAVVAGVGMAGAAMWRLGSSLTPLPAPKADAVLSERGPYALVRHPIYGGIVLSAFGWGLLTASLAALVAAAALLVFFDLKSRLEETWLEERYPGYPAYRARTRRLLPWVY